MTRLCVESGEFKYFLDINLRLERQSRPSLFDAGSRFDEFHQVLSDPILAGQCLQEDLFRGQLWHFDVLFRLVLQVPLHDQCK